MGLQGANLLGRGQMSTCSKGREYESALAGSKVKLQEISGKGVVLVALICCCQSRA